MQFFLVHELASSAHGSDISTEDISKNSKTYLVTSKEWYNWKCFFAVCLHIDQMIDSNEVGLQTLP